MNSFLKQSYSNYVLLNDYYTTMMLSLQFYKEICVCKELHCVVLLLCKLQINTRCKFVEQCAINQRY